MPQTIRFLKHGAIRKIHDTKDPEIFSGSFGERASHVEPVRLVLRLLFHAIRRAVSDRSRLAAFTRQWPCLWRARIFNGPTLGPFKLRTDAIQAELAWLHEHWILQDTEKAESYGS